MTTDTAPTSDSLTAWREVIALLVEAANHGAQESHHRPAVHSVAMEARGLAALAISLLPEDLDSELDLVELDPSTRALSAEGLVLAAEAAMQQHPLNVFPPGAEIVIGPLGDLARQALA